MLRTCIALSTLLALAAGPEYFETAEWWITSWVGNLVMLLSLWGMWYHYLAGLRHLAFDAGKALDIPTAEKLGCPGVVAREARAFRLGQENEVYVYRLCARQTLEETAYALGINKSRLASTIADENDVGRVYTEEDMVKHPDAYHTQYLGGLVDDRVEQQMLQALKVDMSTLHAKTINLMTHDGNVKVAATEAADQMKVKNLYQNELNRQAALGDTRVLAGAVQCRSVS